MFLCSVCSTRPYLIRLAAISLTSSRCRRATIGSTFMADRAGIKVAASATTASKIATLRKLSGSYGRT